MTIATMLDDLAERRAELEIVKAEIAARAGELAERQASIEKEIECLEGQIKDKAKYIPDSQAHTLVGRLLQLVWTKGKMDAKKLEALARSLGASDEQVAGCKGDGFWSIRKRAK